MSDWRFLSLSAIHWIWPVLGLVVWWMSRVWGERDVLKSLFLANESSLNWNRQFQLKVIHIILMGLAMSSVVVALMQPVTFGQESVQESSIEADVVVALDLSKSMWAEDAPPSRLERAKYEVMEMVDAMPAMEVSNRG